MNRARLLTLLGPATMALAQMAAPTPAAAAFMVVPICGQPFAGRGVPIRLPGKPDPLGGGPCCKICHISMRKRGNASGCCDEGDEPDVI